MSSKDPFTETLERVLEVLKDPDYKPHLIELLKAHVDAQRAVTRDLESQTLARLERLHRSPRDVQNFR